MEPELRPLCTVTNIGGKTVVSAEIQEIDNELKPWFYKGVGRLKGSYVRVQGTEMGSDNAVGEHFIDNARIDGNIVKFQRQAVDKLPDGAHNSPACRAGENKARHSRQTPQQKSEILQLNWPPFVRNDRKLSMNGKQLLSFSCQRSEDFCKDV